MGMADAPRGRFGQAKGQEMQKRETVRVPIVFRTGE